MDGNNQMDNNQTYINNENNLLVFMTKLGDTSEKKKPFLCRPSEAVQQVLCQLYMMDALGHSTSNIVHLWYLRP